MTLRGEPLLLPARVYYDAAVLNEACEREGLAGTIALCLGTRHYNGFLRQACVTRLLGCEQYWAVPFVLQLLGEYVVEVILPIEAFLKSGAGQAVRDFVAENARYMVTLEKRALSYWDCYYRQQFSDKQDYPGIRAISALQPGI